MSHIVEDRRTPLWRKLAGLAVLAGAGAASGYGVATLTRDRLDSWPDETALLVAATLVASGIAVAVIVALRPRRIPRGCGVLQSLVLLLAGVMMALPVLGPGVAAPAVVMAGVVLILLGQTVANLMLWRAADEMLRRVMLETAALAFAASQLLLFLYGAAERLGLVEAVSAWALIAPMMALYLLASMVAAARRGLS